MSSYPPYHCLVFSILCVYLVAYGGARVSFWKEESGLEKDRHVLVYVRAIIWSTGGCT